MSEYMEQEKALLQYLKEDYEKDIRPVLDKDTTVKVSHGISLTHLHNVDIASSTITLHLWVRMVWVAPLLSWNDASSGTQFDQVSHIRVPSDTIWKPDIILYNGMGEDRYLEEANAIISRDGTVLWIPVIISQVHCNFDLTYFPFDTQTCNLRYGSWTHDGFLLDLEFYDKLDNIDLSDYNPNPEWEVLSTSAKKRTKYYPCCEEPYPDITYTMKIQRRGLYYSYMLVTPAVVLMLLIPFMFLAPSSSSMKIQFGVGLLICETLALTLMSNYLPTAHFALPRLAQFYITCFVMTSISLVINIVIINLANMGIYGKAPPQILKTILLDFVGRILCVKREQLGSYRYRRSNLDVDDSSVTGGEGNVDDTAKFANSPQSNGKDMDWFLIAVVLDRFLFCIFVVICLITVFVCSGVLHNV